MYLTGPFVSMCTHSDYGAIANETLDKRREDDKLRLGKGIAKPGGMALINLTCRLPFLGVGLNYTFLQGRGGEGSMLRWGGGSMLRWGEQEAKL